MEVNWLEIGMGLFGGLALFLGGLEQLSQGLKQAAGPTLRTVLARLTVNRFAGALTGAIVTGMLNSSSVTTVLVVGFVTAGVMTLSQSVGVIMGANVGSTLTAQMLAFNVSAYALAPVAIGFFMLFLGKRERVRQYGTMLLGLGLVFFGMGIMSEGMKPLRSFPPFLSLLAKMERPLLGVVVGALFTALVQSSAATMGIAIALASEGLLSLSGGLTLALGANIGTCATALLAAIGKPPTAVRAAVVHLMFNVLGTLLWLPMLPVLAAWAVRISPSVPDLSGLARAAAEVPRQLANANTVFNIANTLIFLPFTGLFASLAERLVKDVRRAPVALIEPEFLDEAALAVPTLALDRVRQEVGRLGGIAQEMLDEFGPALQDRDAEHLTAIFRRSDELGVLEAAILRFLGLLRQESLTQRESRELQELMEAVISFESIGQVVAKDLADIARQADRLRPSAETAEMLWGLYDSVRAATALAVRAVRGADPQAAEEVVAQGREIDDRVRALLERQAARLRPDDPEYLVLARLQMSIVEQLGRVYQLGARGARAVLSAMSEVG